MYTFFGLPVDLQLKPHTKVCHFSHLIIDKININDKEHSSYGT